MVPIGRPLTLGGYERDAELRVSLKRPQPPINQCVDSVRRHFLRGRANRR